MVKEYTLADMLQSDCLLKVIAGSRAYGLSIPTSDTDIRGIYMIPNDYLLGFGYREQFSQDNNDTIYYELNRFVELLLANNPNIIELLFTPEDKILHFDPRLAPLYDNRNMFLTKQIRETFGNYAISQIKKARGLNKKIVNPIAKKKLTPLDFCYIIDKNDGYTMLASQWLRKHNKKMEYCGLAELPNGKQMYKLYYDYLAECKTANPRYANIETNNFRGIVSEDSDQLRHSEIPKHHDLEAFLYYNMDGYSSYCRDYREYWEWVSNRNTARYNENMKHGKGYDGKSLMHCIRLLDMAVEIANGQGVNLVRPNRDWLLSVRRGELDYNEVVSIAETRVTQLDEAMLTTTLPETVDKDFAQSLLLKMRQ